MEIPEGFVRVEATVCRKGDDLLVFGVLDPEGPFAFSLKLGDGPAAPEIASDGEVEAEAKAGAEGEGPGGPESWGPAPEGFEWTGEVRPPLKGEYFWSEIRGRVVEAVQDETGFNRFGEPTGGRRILRPVAAPATTPPGARPRLRIVRDGDEG